MGGEREIEEETRNQMMQNLFGDQSEEEEEDDEEEDEEEEDDAESERGPLPPHHSAYHSEEGEGDAEIEGEGEVDIEGQGEVEAGSDEMHGLDADQEESEAERVQSSQGKDASDQRSESEEKDVESEEHGYGQRVVTSKRREVIASDSERSEEDNRYDNNDEMEVDQERKASSPSGEQDHAVVRDVFGDSDEEETADYEARNKFEQDQIRSPVEEENYAKPLGPEDMVPDEDAHYESEDENAEQKAKEKPMGPPMDMEIPLQRPPAMPEKMNMIKVSNIMGIEPKPFDPKTFIEEDVFVTDESGSKKRIRLEDNIVRWRSSRNRDGSISYESNARFVKWSDGSLQLLIGNEVLDLSVQESQHDKTHLFLRHGKGILQSQGRLLRKMRFMPSSLSSKSHRLLTALVDSRHKKVYKVKNCITDIDPEREKEEKERAEGQSIRANELLQRKREKVTKKYTPSADRGRQLSPGFLEEAMDEDDEHGDYHSRRSAARRRFEEDMELESQAERRIINAKRSHALKDVSRKQSMPSSRQLKRPVEEYSESEREESEYETEGEDIERTPVHRTQSDNEDEYAEQDDEETGAVNVNSEDEEDEELRRDSDTGGGGIKRKDLEWDEEESPPRKSVVHRRKAVVFDSDED